MNKVREPLPGEILGQNYLLEAEIGRGGFGVVFKARHIDIERLVAIKVLLATYARRDPRAKDRFKREATIAASLNYPNSLRIFDYGETEEGVFYLVMEFVQGHDLAHFIEKEGTLAIPRAIHITRQILYSLMEAHARGIVHRDIKPDNVMLTELAYDTDHVKVMDFGIAKMVDAGEEITTAGITLGTPRYMPIEQLKGEHLGPATDLYAVGLVLYEMLVGRPAFTGDSAVDTAVAVMEGGSVKVPDDALVPEALRALIAKASSRHAEDRFQSARAFLEALNALDPALLDIDDADREHFAGPAAAAEPRKHSTTAELRVDKQAAKASGDFEDAIATQAISTEEVLAAHPPRGGLSVSEHEASTGELKLAALNAAAAAAVASATVTSAAVTAPSAAAAAPVAETTAMSFPPLPSPLAQPSAKPPLVLVVTNAAILIIVLIILFRIL